MIKVSHNNWRKESWWERYKGNVYSFIAGVIITVITIGVMIQC